jgi:hypothetical protein
MLAHIGRYLRRLFAIDRRYGARHSGGVERSGFYSRREAEGWLRDRGMVGVIYYYDPIDLRLVGADKAVRESFRP